MVYRSLKPTITALSLSLLLAWPTGAVYAQGVDVPDNSLPGESYDAEPSEPTTVDELAPSGDGEVIPGTEPLYDKGVTVTQIEIEGNQLVPDDVILKAMGTHPGSLYSKTRLQKDLRKIYDLGYFSERIRVVPVATREGVHLRIEVEENPVVKQFEFDGETVIKDEELQALFTEQIGMPQNVNALNKGIQAIEEHYKDKGYILARVDNIQEDPPGTIHLTINEGKINTIRYSGNKKTKDAVIRRAMAQKEGEVYNENTVNDDMKRIFSLQSFSDVRRVIKASPDVPGAYDLVMEVDEKKTGAISLGGGVDTGTGLFGSVGYSDPNFRGRGQSMTSVFSMGTGVLGSDDDTLTRRVIQAQVNWFNPSVAESVNSLGTSLFARDLASFNVPLAIEKRFGGEITWGRPLESISGASVSLGLGGENVNLKEGVSQRRLDEYDISPEEREKQLEDGAFAFLTPNFAFDSRNNRFNPNQGWLINLGSRLAYGIDTDSYGTLTANLRRYLKVTDNVTLALNAQGGGTPFGDIPTFNMFRLGGSYTVRGFQEGGIGVGGNFVLGSAEVRTKIPFLKAFDKFPLYEILQAAIFTDAGVLFDEASTNSIFDRPGYGVSVGAGIRANIPSLGPIRIDWANPIGNTGDHTRRINFGVGHKF